MICSLLFIKVYYEYINIHVSIKSINMTSSFGFYSIRPKCLYKYITLSQQGKIHVLYFNLDLS